MQTLEAIDDGIWVATRPLPIAVGDVGARMTVLRAPDGSLLLHSPVHLDPPLRDAIDALGHVRWLVGPSKVHHLFLGEWVSAYPGATLCGVPGLAEKRRDLAFHAVLDHAPHGWPAEVALQLIDGAPLMNEVALLHRPSRTLVLTDLVFNVMPGGRNRARLFHWLVGATGRFGPHRIVRFGIRDRAAARRSLDAILGWDFDRVVMSHGEILAAGGRERMRDAFAYLR